MKKLRTLVTESRKDISAMRQRVNSLINDIEIIFFNQLFLLENF